MATSPGSMRSSDSSTAQAEEQANGRPGRRRRAEQPALRAPAGDHREVAGRPDRRLFARANAVPA